jgi:siroheme synthase
VSGVTGVTGPSCGTDAATGAAPMLGTGETLGAPAALGSATALPAGTVAFVGAGPGDPELVTLRAEAMLAVAEVVVTDAAVVTLARRLAHRAEVWTVEPTVADHVAANDDAANRPSAQNLYRIGADGANHADPSGGATARRATDATEATGATATAGRNTDATGDTGVTPATTLVAAATAGLAAVRLYHGDPWLHPAYAHDVAQLDATGVAHQTVPGLVPEWATLATAGIAVHHRPRAVTVTLGPLTELPAVVDPARTLVCTVADLRAGAVHLAATGDGTLPAAAIAAAEASPDHTVRRGTTTARAEAPASGLVSPGRDHQRVQRGTLDDLACTAPRGPGVLVVGAVAEGVTRREAGAMADDVPDPTSELATTGRATHEPATLATHHPATGDVAACGRATHDRATGDLATGELATHDRATSDGPARGVEAR